MNRLKRPALLPLVPLYRAGLWLKERLLERAFLTQHRLQSRVISIGSLSAGGAGKTPVVMLVAAMLREAGYTVDILSRGYGRTGKGVEQVDPNGPAARFGDEPTLMARRLQLPVWVGSDRFAAGQAAEASASPNAESSPRIHLLDDGFQHRKLHRDLDLVLLTLKDVQDTLLPAGNLREPLSALRRAQIVVIREEEAPALKPCLPSGRTVWVIRRTLTLPNPTPPHPLVFCGIARPEGFLAMLKTQGIDPAAVMLFEDHHAYGMRDITRLLASARVENADGVLTTEKDLVKLTPAMLKRLESAGPTQAGLLEVSLIQGTSADLTLLNRKQNPVKS